MAERIFKRKIYDRMLKWKQSDDGKTALLIQGARRVGKSTIAEEFARKEYDSYILIDFSKATAEVMELFDDMSDLDYFFMRLQVAMKGNLKERHSVIIFDEVQFQPKARQAIKHLVKDHRYDYIETGSLISIRKNVKDILIPSEEEKINMFPMDFEEFLWATDDETTVPLLRQFFDKFRPLGDAAHRKVMRSFRLWMLVGGMPQAVNEYLESNNMELVDRRKRAILSLYDEDFTKIDPSGKASLMFDSIPAQLSSNASRFLPSKAFKGGRSDRLTDILHDMKESMTISMCYHANDPSVGFSLNEDFSRYKMFMGDTGLFVTRAFKDKAFTENVIYQKLLSDKLATNLGYVYENAVAQMLRAKGDNLFYFTMQSESSKHLHEIDFLISRGSKICPIEVKSKGYDTHKSFDEFCRVYSSRISDRYIVYTKDLQHQEMVRFIPVYMTMFL